MSNRKVIVYIAVSIDGYIAKPGDDLSFLERMQTEGEDYGYQFFIQTVDAVIMGRKTYDWVMKQVDEFPHADKPTWVITRTPQASQGNLHFYNGSLATLVQQLTTQPGKNIFVDGGAEIIHLMMEENLIDEWIISVIPVFLGEGTRLFKDHRYEQIAHLVSVQSFKTGLVQLHYKKEKL